MIFENYSPQKICRSFFVNPGNYWAYVMLGQPHVRASRASSAQKWQSLRFFFFFKNFSRATFFVFWVTQLVNLVLSYLPVKQI
jgi:hypothetical protein